MHNQPPRLTSALDFRRRSYLRRLKSYRLGLFANWNRHPGGPRANDSPSIQVIPDRRPVVRQKFFGLAVNVLGCWRILDHVDRRAGRHWRRSDEDTNEVGPWPKGSASLSISTRRAHRFTSGCSAGLCSCSTGAGVHILRHCARSRRPVDGSGRGRRAFQWRIPELGHGMRRVEHLEPCGPRRQRMAMR